MQKPIKRMKVQELQKALTELKTVEERLLASLGKVRKVEEAVRNELVQKKSIWVSG
jgi:hypothetical protein